VLQETGSGWQVSGGAELTGLLELLLEDRSLATAAGERARSAHEERFRGEVVLGRYSRLVDELLAGPA
jgi:hypothetical protein